MSRYLQDLLTAAKAVKTPSFELRKAIEAVEEHLNDPRRRKILELGRTALAREGELEFDDDAITSEGDDNGAYVQAWAWVDFAGTNLDKHQPTNASPVQEKTEPNQDA